MRLGGDVVEQLAVVEQGNHESGWVDPGQSPVIGAAAATEAYTVAIDRETRHDHHIGLRDRERAQTGSGWLGQAARHGYEGAVVVGPVQIEVVPKDREEYPGYALGEHRRQRRTARLAGHRHVSRHGSRDARDDPRAQSLAYPRILILEPGGAAGRENGGAQVTLGTADRVVAGSDGPVKTGHATRPEQTVETHPLCQHGIHGDGLPDSGSEVTLRARLTGAFLVVVVGPVLLGAVFVGGTVNAVNQSRERERLDVAVTSLRTAIDATCVRLRATAEAAAIATMGGTRPAAAQVLVDAGRAGAIRIESGDGTSVVTTTAAPATPWAMCTPPPFGNGLAEDGDRALAAVVEMRGTDGRVIGYVYAAQALDSAYLSRLASATGVGITMSRDSARTTEVSTVARHVAKAARGLGSDRFGRADGQYVRRVDPTPGQPLSVALSVPVTTSQGLIAVVVAVVLFAALAAVGAARVLARGTTRPLDEIAEAAERISRGDLNTRVPVRHDDEVGHLGAAFNRMTRDMRSYATALAASRDQLRGNLDILGDTLSSTHDLPRILRVILASAVRATGARAGAVMLVDPEDGSLRLQCAEGFESTLPESTVALGEGLTGGVAATGVARRGRIVEGRSGRAPGEPDCRTYLAVPLRVPPGSPSSAGLSGALAQAWSGPLVAVVPDSGIRGVLALYDRAGGDEFDDTDLRTVRTFASHAAVAVDNVRLHDEARRLSNTDPLTGLDNYRHLKDLLRREAHRSSRFGHPLCVVVMDLDHFKDVNDTYGHAAGDAVLVEFARRVRAEIRGVDLAFRYGGEEFVLLLPETDGIGGVTLAQRLGAAIRTTPVPVAGRGRDRRVEIPVSVSIGLAVFPEHGTTGPRVLEAADEALYAAKAAGRDTFRLATDQKSDGGSDPAAAKGTATDGAARGGASGGPRPPSRSCGR